MLNQVENQPQPTRPNQPKNQNLQNHLKKVDQEAILDLAQQIERSELKSNHKECDKNFA